MRQSFSLFPCGAQRRRAVARPHATGPDCRATAAQIRLLEESDGPALHGSEAEFPSASGARGVHTHKVADGAAQWAVRILKAGDGGDVILAWLIEDLGLGAGRSPSVDESRPYDSSPHTAPGQPQEHRPPGHSP